MKKIHIVGADGQIGSELTRNLRDIYGDTNVVCSDLRPLKGDPYEHEHLDKCIEAFKKVRKEIEG